MRLEINGIVCGLITQESEEYMKALAGEVGDLMRGVLEASPYITREAAALTAALSCCDDAKKNGTRAAALQERVDELEVEAELWKEEKEELLKSVVDSQKDARLQERAARLEAENTALSEAAQRAKELEEKTAALEDENTALRESASIGAEALRELAALRERLRELEEQAPGKSEEGEKLLQLEGEIEALQHEAEEQSARAKRAEDEKDAAVTAAKQAMEEAKGTIDQLREEARKAREEAKRLREAGASPALDTLERQAAEAREDQRLQEVLAKQEAANAKEEKPQPPKAAKPAQPTGRKKRKNPLRYEDEFQQEGFVSFFEKKD